MSMAEGQRGVPVIDRAEIARRETRRFVKFLIVGGIGFLIDTGTLSVLVLLLSVDPVLAKGVAFSLAVVSNFVWNRLWTYPESRSMNLAAQIAQFALISCVGLGINLVIFGWVDRIALRWLSSLLALYAAQCAAVGVALFWNFGANRFITYRGVQLGD